MESSNSDLVCVLATLFLLVSTATATPNHDPFLKCLSQHLLSSIEMSQLVFTANSSSYTSLLHSSIRNLRFLSSKKSKPLFIVAPTDASQVQASVICCRKHDLHLRVRSGGHDYEGLSYLSADQSPFIIIDLIKFRSISINIEEGTAWVEAGATIGEVYCRIAEKSSSHGFPAGIFPTVGVSGHFGGGGVGTMMRKHGLAADHIVDAYLVDSYGKIHDRKSMGEGLFWAIRGGGVASFGVILSWKIRLVPVPPTVCVFTLDKTLEQGAAKLVHRWQYIAPKLHKNLFIRVIVQIIGERKIHFLFNSLFLGGVEELIPLMDENFPELGLKPENCTEMSWVKSILYFAGYPSGKNDPINALLSRHTLYKDYFKAKSDFVTEPISEIGLEGIWKRFMEEHTAFMIMDPMGGRMNEISEDEIPFPHRKGSLYSIQYLVKWDKEEIKNGEYKKHIDWIRRLYRYMSPYVSKSPRAAYLNYRDLDLGWVKGENFSYSKACIWGRRYFKGNFRRLALVKGAVDPDNFFKNEQSIPPLTLY